MPARAKIAQLPVEVRQRLEAKCIELGFSRYHELSDWLASEGYRISRSAVHRHGHALERRLAQIDASTRAAAALMDSNPDAEGNLAAATIKAAQSGLFELLMAADTDSVDSEALGNLLARVGRTAADLARADVTIRRERERVLAAATKAIEREAKRQGLSGDMATALRAALAEV